MSSSQAQGVDAVFVLGNANTKKGLLLPISLERITKAVAVFKEKKARLLITSGGKGSHFNQSRWEHCDLMRKEAIKQGISPIKVKASLLAQTTVDEILSIRYLCKKNRWKHICIVTSASHMLRVRLMAKLALQIPVELVSSQETRFHPKQYVQETYKFFPTMVWLLKRLRQPFPKKLIRL